MNRDLLWIGGILLVTLGGTFLNEKYNLPNPELERRLVGCWAGATASATTLAGAFVLQVNADGTFSETGIEKLINDPKFTKVVNGSGSWKLQKDRWTLSYDESTAMFLFPRAGHSLNLVVAEVTEDEISAKAGTSVSLPYKLSRAPTHGGPCKVQSQASHERAEPHPRAKNASTNRTQYVPPTGSSASLKS